MVLNVVCRINILLNEFLLYRFFVWKSMWQTSTSYWQNYTYTWRESNIMNISKTKWKTRAERKSRSQWNLKQTCSKSSQSIWNWLYEYHYFNIKLNVAFAHDPTLCFFFLLLFSFLEFSFLVCNHWIYFQIVFSTKCTLCSMHDRCSENR